VCPKCLFLRNFFTKILCEFLVSSKRVYILLRYNVGSRVSSGSIVSDYGLGDRAIGVRSPAGAKYFSSSTCFQTGAGAHTASCPMGTGGPFPGGKAQPMRDADASPHLVPRSKMSRGSISHISSGGCIVQRDVFFGSSRYQENTKVCKSFLRSRFLVGCSLTCIIVHSAWKDKSLQKYLSLN
jgi:hypothetical protein